MCSVKLWHRPWINSTKIAVRDIWFVDANDGGISETVRLVNETDRGLERALLEDAVRNFNTHDGKPYIYKLSSATERIRKRNGEEIKMLEATLTETACANVKDQLESFKKNNCYHNLTKNEVRCTLPVNKDTLTNARFLECKRLTSSFRGMWRAKLHEARKVAPRCFDLNGTSNEPGSGKVGIIKMKNFARSDLRVLSADEINDTAFQELLERVIVKYNNASKHDHLYKFKKVDNVKLEAEPVHSFTFSLWVEETPCMKSQATASDTKCADITETLPDGRTEQCQVTVTSAVSDDGANETVAFDQCKSVAGFMGYLLGGKQHIKPGTLSHETGLVIAEQAVWRYNSQSNDVREYRLENVQNVASKVVSGYRYMMNITMKAVSCKNTKDSTCLDPSKREYLHCAVSARQKPAAHEHEINITGCWRHATLTLATDWTYSYLSPEELLQLQGGDVLKSVMETYHVLNKQMEESEVDYLSDGLKITDGENELISFKLHVKGNEKKQTKYKCDVIVIKQKGQPEKRRLSKCIEKPPPSSKRIPLGGPKEISAEQQRRPEFRMKIRNAVRKFNNMANDLYYHRILRVENPVTQVVAGVLTSFRLHLQQTNCLKNKHTQWHSEKAPHLCGKLNNTHSTVCSVKMWSKPWENFTQIDLQECQLSAMESPIMVQSISDDIQATDEFKELVSYVALMFNLNSNEKILYQSHLVDDIIRAVETPDQMEFNLTMSPTSCQKWDNVIDFTAGRYVYCTGTQDPQKFARCRVKIVEFDKGATAQLSNCEYVYFGEYRPRRPLYAWEQATALFQEVASKAVNVFNTRVDSLYWYKLFTIEDPTIEHISGPQYTFTLYMLREACRNTRSINGSNQDELQKLCGESKTEYMASCHVRYWQRSWITFHETIDVSDCELIPITQKALSDEHQTMLDRKQSQESNLRCISSQAKRWLKLFTDQVNLGEPYEKVAIEEMEESPVPGKRLTFEIYFKPESAAEECSESNQGRCTMDRHFYVCQGSYWWKNWKNEETLELSQCKNISRFKTQATKTEGDSVHSDMELKEMVSKAVELYNEKLADFYIFGEDSVQNVMHKTEAGKKTMFHLKMKPVSCKPTSGRRKCEPQLSQNRVECSVTIWQRPWLGENERIWLQNCHDSYSYPSSAGVHQISGEEENSDAFKDAVKRLGEMYSTEEPIIYKAKHENATAQQNATQRLIRLILILEPIGCDYTKPNSNTPNCRDWKNQDTVKCAAEIIQELGESSRRMLRLTGCGPIMDPIAERPLKPSEYETSSFKRTLRKAWELFHQIMSQSGQMFNVVDVKDGTIERDREQKIKYAATFEETICTRGIDDYRFEGVYASDCSRKTPHVLRNCEVKVTTNEKGEHVAVSCTPY
ncbi:hypothetical protein CRM22_000137 [Opisthorchis felineus]|uniref:Cystatin domain-containing protein n=1 Tax=Opisthorchis felineus TaxID=147828 RepID=A0A4S2MLA6_OPIFE|nr:hypothetical protein CRM22_000137 [Opisthorchis felineus]